MKHVRLKEETKASIQRDGFGHPAIRKKLLSEKAFGVDYSDKEPVTNRVRVYLLDDDGFTIFGWVYEDMTEAV